MTKAKASIVTKTRTKTEPTTHAKVETKPERQTIAEVADTVYD